MELEDFVARRDDHEEAFAAVVAKILPLPPEVTPSENFLKTTRLQLLKLDGVRKRSTQQVAA